MHIKSGLWIILCSGFAQNAFLYCLKFSVWCKLCSNHRARATRQCDSLRTSVTSQCVLQMSQSCFVPFQSCCVTSLGCSVISQNYCKTTQVITTRDEWVLWECVIPRSNSITPCSYSTCLSYNTIASAFFGVIWQLCKNCKIIYRYNDAVSYGYVLFSVSVFAR